MQASGNLVLQKSYTIKATWDYLRGKCVILFAEHQLSLVSQFSYDLIQFQVILRFILIKRDLGTYIKLPASVADLATGLTNVDGDALALKEE